LVQCDFVASSNSSQHSKASPFKVAALDAGGSPRCFHGSPWCSCIVFFRLGKLSLKIPWKNLYTEPTVAQLDGLFVIVVPNTSMIRVTRIRNYLK